MSRSKLGSLGSVGVIGAIITANGAGCTSPQYVVTDTGYSLGGAYSATLTTGATTSARPASSANEQRDPTGMLAGGDMIAAGMPGVVASPRAGSTQTLSGAGKFGLSGTAIGGQRGDGGIGAAVDTGPSLAVSGGGIGSGPGGASTIMGGGGIPPGGAGYASLTHASYSGAGSGAISLGGSAAAGGTRAIGGAAAGGMSTKMSVASGGTSTNWTGAMGGSGGTNTSRTTATGGNTTGGATGRGGSVAAGGSVANSIPTDPDLLLWYRFDETAGSAAIDASGHNQNGSIATLGSGTVAHSANHRVGSGSLELTSTGPKDGSYVAVPSSLAGMGATAEFTLACWVFLKSNQSWQRVFDFGSTSTTSYMFLTLQQNFSSPNSVRFAITTGGWESEQRIDMTTPDVLSINTWHHLAVVVDPVITFSGTLYIDGSVAGTNTKMTLRPSDLGTTSNNWLGRSQYESDPLLNGLLDDFRIYRRALTAAEIKKLVTDQ